MLRNFLFILLSLAALAGTLWASPITAKELDFMVRMHTPENDIVADAARRHLLSPIDDAAARMLTADGASAQLIARLKNGNFALSATEASTAQAEAARQSALIASEKARDEAAYAARKTDTSNGQPSSDKMLRLLDGKLVRMENGSLQPVLSSDLRQVRYFALYYSALWCGPCRQFTPHLVDFYKKQKAAHPEFEIIFVSNDKSAQGMEEYMKKDEMPWPAVRYDLIDKSIKQYAVRGIPWLIVLDDSGRPLAPTGEDPNHPVPASWSSPEDSLSALNSFIASGPARRPSGSL